MNEDDKDGTSVKITFLFIITSDCQSRSVEKVNLILFLYYVQESYKY
jgi:hypothetical protein